jgi:general secretion pathway protein J
MSQRGFTLLELMVAMAIFAMLAVAGWQVFDSVNRARERAQFHADNVAVLQYTYLQLQQDMGQIIPYQAINVQQGSISSNDGNQASNIQPEPFMRLDDEQVSFVRFADPDPRYQSSTSLQHVEYVFVDERLIRRQYTSLDGGRDSVSLDSVLLEGVTAGRWQAYLPELSSTFPNEDGSSVGKNVTSEQPAGTVDMQPEVALLPKGIAVSFTYQDMPITWQWALAPQPLPQSSRQNVPNKNSNNNGNDGSEAGSVGEETSN